MHLLNRVVIERTLRAYAAAWGARDRAAWLATFAESATQEDPVGDRVRRGREEIGEFWDAAFSAYQTIELMPRNIFVAGGEAAMDWTIGATNANGTTTFDGVDVFTFDDAGRIRSVRAYWERERAFTGVDS